MRQKLLFSFLFPKYPFEKIIFVKPKVPYPTPLKHSTSNDTTREFARANFPPRCIAKCLKCRACICKYSELRVTLLWIKDLKKWRKRKCRETKFCWRLDANVLNFCECLLTLFAACCATKIHFTESGS